MALGFLPLSRSWLNGTSANHEATIYSGTPDTGQTGQKSAIRAYGLNSSGRSQLGFLVSNSTANVSAVNSDVSMLMDGGKVGVGHSFGSTLTTERLDCHDGNIEISDSHYLSEYGI